MIDPNYPKTSSKAGRRPYPLATMLRIHLLQQWYDLSDPAMEDELVEVPRMRPLAGIDMISHQIPDEITILAFRHLLEKHDLGKQIFEVVKAHLKTDGIALKQGTIIDATLIAAPTSTKNEKKEGSGDAPDQENQPVVLRNEGPHPPLPGNVPVQLCTPSRPKHPRLNPKPIATLNLGRPGHDRCHLWKFDPERKRGLGSHSAPCPGDNLLPDTSQL